MNNNQIPLQSRTLFGHPTGLFTLFFAEMWERFSYYGMRALLLFYMVKGFLGYGDRDGYAVYGAYTALVYMTPFFGGMLADRLLGARRAVVLGGLLMAAGHLMMTVENHVAFFTALALLICGNGFFKPNISTIVGSLYPQGSPKRDGGFTIFYMGINLGAAMSPLLCGYIGETYGWHYGFGLATIGMLTGVAVFVNWLPPEKAGDPPDWERLRARPVLISQLLIMGAAITAAVGLFVYHPENPFVIGIHILVGISLLAAGVIACVALKNGVGGLINIEWGVYLGAILLIPVFVLLVSGFSPLTKDKRPVTLVPASVINQLSADELMYAQLKKTRKAVESSNEARIDRDAAALERLQKNGDLQDQQYAAFREVVKLAKAKEWAKAQAMVEGLSADEMMQAQRKKLREAIESRNEAAIDRLADELERLQEKNDLQDRQYARLREILKLAKGQEWEKAQAKVEQSRGLFPRARMKNIAAVFLGEMSKPAGLILLASGLLAIVYLGIETFRLDKVHRERMFVVLILTFFSMLFWAFFEQAGSSVNNFTDRNVDRVFERDEITADDVGKTIKIQPTQEQLGYHNGDQLFTNDVLDKLRDQQKEEKKDPDFVIEWTVAKDNLDMGGMGIAKRTQEIPASTLQSINPIYILILGLPFTVLWAVLSKLRLEPSTPVKFALGLLQLGLGFGAFWYGAQAADERGMVALGWLLLGYLLHTTGELCLSPVGLSMVTKLSPRRLVSTVMGVWFLATAFSQLLAAIIAQFTGVVEENSAGENVIPVPKETVDVYGDVFGTIAISAMVSALICLVLAPLLTRWMHPEEDVPEEPEAGEQA